MDESNQDNNVKSKPTNSTGSKFCTLVILIFGFIVTLAILLYWVIVKPRQPIFSVDEGVVQGYALTSNNHLNAACRFAVRAYNPNTKLYFMFESLEIKVYHGGIVVGYAGVNPFSQTNGNVTYLRFGGVASDMPLFESPGEIHLNVELNGKFWYKLGSMKLHRYKVKANCFPVVVYFNSTKGFQSTNCNLKVK